MDTEKDESTKHAGGEASGSAAGSPAPKATEKERTRQDAGSTAPASLRAKKVRFEEPGRDSDGREQRKRASETRRLPKRLREAPRLSATALRVAPRASESETNRLGWWGLGWR